MPYAWHPGTEKILHAEDAHRGAACDCVCLDCKAPVLAKQGEVLRWHFAHKADWEGTCNYSPETALHARAKQMLAERLPDPQLFAELAVVWKSDNGTRYSRGSLQVNVRNWQAEKGYPNTPYIGDVASTPYFFEVKVEHACEPEKVEALRRTGFTVIEIDLSQTPRDLSDDDLREAIAKAPRELVTSPERTRLIAEAKLETERKRREHAEDVLAYKGKRLEDEQALNTELRQKLREVKAENTRLVVPLHRCAARVNEMQEFLQIQLEAR
jgi:hypothetical protein